MAELKLNRLNIKPFVIAFFYALITIFAVLNHETWADEAQVWMLTKYISFTGLFPHLVNEGHPPFFYLLVMPFAKLFNNIIWMQLICWFSSVLAIFLLWNNSKFSSLTKTIITLSAPFIYFFPTIARSYSIIPLLVFLLAIFHNKTKENPYIYSITLFLLFNLHSIMYIFCAILGIRFLLKNFKDKKLTIPSIIVILGFLAPLILLFKTTSSNVAINFENKDYIASIARVFGLFIFNSFDSFFIKANSLKPNFYSILMPILAILSWLFINVLIFKNNKKIFLLFFLSVFSQFLIYILTYSYHIYPTRIYIVYVIAIFSFWVILKDENKKLLNLALIFIFLLTFINSFKNYYGDLLFDYTPSHKLSKYIKQNIDLNNSEIYIDNPQYSIALSYYLTPKFYLINIHNEKPLKYIYWKNYPLLSDENWRNFFISKRNEGNKKELYALINYNYYQGFLVYDFSEKYFEPIYKTGASLVPSETFTLYKFKE